MTIKPDEAWGRTIDRPTDLVVIGDDHELAARLAAIRDGRGGPPVFAGGGDLARTLGGPPIDGRLSVSELPIDLVDVRLDGGAAAATACAHIVITNPWWRGGWSRGSIVIVMNAEYIGDWDVAPRGHPNDGRVEVFEVSSAFGLRQRRQARRRVRSATHVPHPDIDTRSVRSASWHFDRAMSVTVDGRRIGTATDVEVAVSADAAVVHA